MKTARLMFVVLVAGLAVIGFGGAALAYHSGGVAECGGCHSMHSPVSVTGLLVATDASSTCLSCHEHAGDTGPTSYHISTAEVDMPAGTPPLQRSPGGDFGWLKKTYTWVVRGNTYTEEGYAHGHNIIAADFNYVADGVNALSPGGTFDATFLSCTSCHDPHSRSRRIAGNEIVASTVVVNPPIRASGSYHNSPIPTTGEAVGVFRLLGGITHYPGHGVTGAFPGSPPAVVPSSYNKAETSLANQVRVAYGSGNTLGNETWGQWCAKCHDNMHSDVGTVHAIDADLRTGVGQEIENYNNYRGSGEPYGTIDDAYWSLVPFAIGSSDYEGTLRDHATSANAVYDDGAATGDEVMCLSCHRAHASSFKYALRWQYEAEFDLVNGLYPGSDSPDPEAAKPQWHQGRTVLESKAGYYDWPETRFGDWQRVLCNKCHNKEN